ncbi:MAG: twin-arginine translocase subunit TatC [Culturomica sp.]|jgi:sec-independent protein translocase protein TatC|nr:twin-arginine translocase subunit TatC [Culturomica sp.]
MKQSKEHNATFWDHLDELRKVIFRIAIAVCVLGFVAFLNKEFLFNLVFAPHRSDFITYRMLCRLGETFSLPGLCPEEFRVELINTRLASQFLTHLTVSAFAGLLVASPYVVFQLFGFVKPALYEHERKYSGRVIVSSFLLFFFGVLLNYLVIFPLSFRFLGTYQVSPDVVNRIDLSSYVSTFMMLSLMMGLVFEIPVVAFFLAKIGAVTPDFLKRHRRHACVVLLIAAALITPTADIFTLLLVALPMYLLYELSICVVRKAAGKTIP